MDGSDAPPVRIPARRQVSRLRAVDIDRLPEGVHADGGNLCLRVRKSGARSWIFRYRIKGKLREHGLGPAHTISLAQARKKALELRQARLEDIDPIEAKNAAKVKVATEIAKAITFKEAAKAYIRAHEKEWSNPKHPLQWATTLRTYAEPTLGDLKVSDIDTAAVIKVLEKLWLEKPETAGRVRGRIEMILDWAAARGFRTGDNPARWKGHLSHLLAARAKVAPVKHFDAMPYGDVPGFMHELAGLEGTSALGLRFLVLTAVRTGEVIGATWAEIDEDNAVWVIPAARMKARRDHRVPLSAAALAVLESARALKQGQESPLFPGGRGDAGLSNMAFLALLRRRQKPFTVHGFRSAFRDWCGEATAHPREIAEAALAHTLESKTEAAYARGDLFEKRRVLMADWAAFCCPASAAPAATEVAKTANAVRKAES